MKLWSRSVELSEPVQYESTVTRASQSMPGVTFVVSRMSLGRRMELSRKIRELSRRAEFLQAGSEAQEKIEAGILAQEVDGLYVHWGLVSIAGLTIDGAPADAGLLLEKGPEPLACEIATAVREQCGLSEAERKN